MNKNNFSVNIFNFRQLVETIFYFYVVVLLVIENNGTLFKHHTPRTHINTNLLPLATKRQT